MSLPGNISLLARLPRAGSGGSGFGTVTGPATSTDFSIPSWNGTTGKILRDGLLVTDANGNLKMGMAAILGFQAYNTADQVTNTEYLQFFWNSNIALIQTIATGTGTQRAMRIGITGGAAGRVVFNVSAANGTFDLIGASSSTASSVWARVAPTYTMTSGSNVVANIIPTYNQASGNAANTDLRIARTETAVGSGTQLFIEMLAGAAGTTSIFSFGTTGILTKPGGAIPLITTSSAITDQAGASVGTLTNAPTAGNPTKWILINDNGTTRKIPTWT